MTMTRVTGVGCGALLCMVVGCAMPEVPTTHKDVRRAVSVQAVDGATSNGAAFSHPAALTEDDVAGVLRGLYVEIENVPLSRFLFGGRKATRRAAFSQREIAFFAPLFVRGLRRAKPDEMVTFYETVEVADLHELTTSGGIFVRDNVLHVVLSNYGVKTEIWQDNERYRAPVRNRPLARIDPEPGRLVFVPAERMAPSQEGWLATLTHGTPWHVGVRLTGLPARNGR